MFHFSIWSYCALHSRARCVCVHMWWFYKDFYSVLLCSFGGYSKSKCWLIAKVSHFSLPSPQAPQCEVSHSQHSVALPLKITAFWPLLLGEEKEEDAGGRAWLSGGSSGDRVCRKMEWLPGEEGRYQERGQAVQSSPGSEQEWDTERRVWKSQATSRACGLSCPWVEGRGPPWLSLWWEEPSGATELLPDHSVLISIHAHLAPRTASPSQTARSSSPSGSAPACARACFSSFILFLFGGRFLSFLLPLRTVDISLPSFLIFFLKIISEIRNHSWNSSPVSAALINVSQEICTSSYLLNYFKLVFHHQPKLNISKSKSILIFHSKYPRPLVSCSVLLTNRLVEVTHSSVPLGKPATSVAQYQQQQTHSVSWFTTHTSGNISSKQLIQIMKNVACM